MADESTRERDKKMLEQMAKAIYTAWSTVLEKEWYKNPDIQPEPSRTEVIACSIAVLTQFAEVLAAAGIAALMGLDAGIGLRKKKDDAAPDKMPDGFKAPSTDEMDTLRRIVEGGLPKSDNQKH